MSQQVFTALKWCGVLSDGLAARGEALTLMQVAQQIQAKIQAVQLMANI